MGQSIASGLQGVFPVNYVRAKNAPRPPPRTAAKASAADNSASLEVPTQTSVFDASNTANSPPGRPGGAPIRGDSGMGRY